MEIPGYRVEGPIGFGADGATWLARDEDGAAVAVRTLGPVSPERQRLRMDRLERLAQVDHPHLARLREVRADAGRTVVVSEAVPGPTLATVRVSRDGVGPSEAMHVGAQVASALLALHHAAITHGDISPSNLVFSPGRGAVVVDLAGEPAWESGTGGFAAPELATGGVATAAADVYALARLVVWLVDTSHRPHLEVLLAPALAPDPARRCGAGELRKILAAYPGADLQVPDASALAGVSLREHAGRDLTRRPRDHRPRHRREPKRRPLALALVMLGVLVSTGVAWAATEIFPRAGADADRIDPLHAVVDLTSARDSALNRADIDDLAALTVPDSPAATQDAALAQSLAEGALVVHGLRTDVIESEQVDSRAEPEQARVRAVLRSHEHTRQTAEATTVVPERSLCAVLELHHDTDRWQVARVDPC